MALVPAQVMPTETGPINPIEKVAAWNAQSGPKDANQDRNAKLREIVIVSNDGAWRVEIKIEMRNEDGEDYNGTITMPEEKHSIYRDGLGFTDFKNFDGVRFSCK